MFLDKYFLKYEILLSKHFQNFAVAQQKVFQADPLIECLCMCVYVYICVCVCVCVYIYIYVLILMTFM